VRTQFDHHDQQIRLLSAGQSNLERLRAEHAEEMARQQQQAQARLRAAATQLEQRVTEVQRLESCQIGADPAGGSAPLWLGLHDGSRGDGTSGMAFTGLSCDCTDGDVGFGSQLAHEQNSSQGAITKPPVFGECTVNTRPARLDRAG
jgi:hypothetical protein